jgi:hypothetical protein
MRLSLLSLVLLIAASFAVGRATAPDSALATANRVYTGRQGDVFRVPSAATRCIVSQEGGFPRLYCARIGGGRYTVDFYKSSLYVWRNGNPDRPAFSARWTP